MDTERERPRDGNGQFVRTLETAERDAECARLRNRGLTFRKIAKELGIDVRTAHDGVQRAMRAVLVTEGAAAREQQLEKLNAQLVRLDDAEQVVIRVMERHHITVQQGQVIRIDGQPLRDDAPTLQAVDRLLKIEDQRRKIGERIAALLGLNAATKMSVDGAVKYEIVGIDPADLG
jgi:hypothetical protein